MTEEQRVEGEGGMYVPGDPHRYSALCGIGTLLNSIPIHHLQSKAVQYGTLHNIT